MSFNSQRSKEDLEKIYNKGQLFRSNKFKDEFTLKARDVKKFNDKVMQDKILNEEYEEENVPPCIEHGESIEVLSLLSEQKPSMITKKYISSVLEIDRKRITCKKLIKTIILLLFIVYLVVGCIKIFYSTKVKII